MTQSMPAAMRAQTFVGLCGTLVKTASSPSAATQSAAREAYRTLGITSNEVPDTQIIQIQFGHLLAGIQNTHSRAAFQRHDLFNPDILAEGSKVREAIDLGFVRMSDVQSVLAFAAAAQARIAEAEERLGSVMNALSGLITFAMASPGELATTTPQRDYRDIVHDLFVARGDSMDDSGALAQLKQIRAGASIALRDHIVTQARSLIESWFWEVRGRLTLDPWNKPSLQDIHNEGFVDMDIGLTAYEAGVVSSRVKEKIKELFSYAASPPMSEEDFFKYGW